jgi:hypothetical protein
MFTDTEFHMLILLKNNRFEVHGGTAERILLHHIIIAYFLGFFKMFGKKYSVKMRFFQRIRVAVKHANRGCRYPNLRKSQISDNLLFF